MQTQMQMQHAEKYWKKQIGSAGVMEACKPNNALNQSKHAEPEVYLVSS